MPSEEYTIVLRGERFLLSANQLHFNAPNYFTMLFEGPFQEAADGKREVVLYRDPNLFRIIETYLSGYKILPHDRWPEYMSKEAAKENLLEDAKFYGLDGLALLLEENLNAAKRDAERKYAVTIQKYWIRNDSSPPQPYQPHITQTNAPHVARLIENARMSPHCDMDPIHRYTMNRIMSEGVPTDLDICWKTEMSGTKENKTMTMWIIKGVSGGEGEPTAMPTGLP